ncbi:uncharacterized protein K489DRAFT_190035 [Dissoconium aciculare CBS 342.82]|uniref:Uncharacterized protein n=1 Tax=Dissoconium aciculare CBS 342.82 TaxID=1314786 RepID=A0A6J3LQZ3_9PEZI|nr:uncharacterized protein K489DRAFT_190035 [Dissoconium aciculare CBS 342.82]KAF1817689.1 hypothetical protein K489DRAFT_190035 [Dissoconium aciculare CBS 342.82]
MTSCNNSFFVAPQYHELTVARINDAQSPQIVDKLNDTHRRLVVVPTKRAEDESKSQHHPPKRSNQTSQHCTH